MPTYLYECPVHGEFEYQHSINEQLEDCPQCQASQAAQDDKAEIRIKVCKVKRLISGGTGFILNGGGWASEGYKSS